MSATPLPIATAPDAPDAPAAPAAPALPSSPASRLRSSGFRVLVLSMVTLAVMSQVGTISTKITRKVIKTTAPQCSPAGRLVRTPSLSLSPHCQPGGSD